MGQIARCEKCKKSFGGIITSEHSCCSPEFTCDGCMSKDDFEMREDPIMNLTQCNDCYKVSKYDQDKGRWECGHKASWLNWCEKCNEVVGRYFRYGTNLCLCDGCYAKFAKDQNLDNTEDEDCVVDQVWQMKNVWNDNNEE